MRITQEEADALGRKIGAAMAKAAPVVPVRAAWELLAVFVPGKLLNPLNASAWIWQKRVRYARAWKERVAVALLEDPNHGGHMARTPKRILFTASTHNRMDSDGLQAALKPVRDALIECGVIHSDAPDSEHVFGYWQKIHRARRGVEIRVSLLQP